MMTENQLHSAIALHGHFCPGLAIGLRVAQACVEQLGTHTASNELVAIAENDL